MFLALRPSIVDLKILILALGLVLFVLTGCSPLYVFQAAYEEGKILWRRQPIERMLERPDLDSDTREKLQLVLAVREYAQEPLKLRVRGSYASYSYVDRPTLSYVLMAAPKTDLRPYTWSYPFVGSFPYKGFFSKEAAEAEAERFQARGYDTYIRTSPAFSTLGWFDDPVLAHLLKYDKVTLAEVIFHELLHNTLFVKGQVSFNESLANFVGRQAAVLFFRERSGEGSPEFEKAAQSLQEELEFSAFIQTVADSLRTVYAQELPEEEKLSLRQVILVKSQEDWKRRVADRPTHRYRGYAEQELNNAVLAHYLLYLSDLALFEALYQAEGKNLARLVESLSEAVRSGSDPFEAARELPHKRKTSTQAVSAPILNFRR
jgi:predicted aminopeptidase